MKKGKLNMHKISKIKYFVIFYRLYFYICKKKKYNNKNFIFLFLSYV